MALNLISSLTSHVAESLSIWKNYVLSRVFPAWRWRVLNRTRYLKEISSMQSKRRSPLPIWPHRETNNYISLLKYYLPRWLTTGYFTVFPFARKCQPNRSSDEKGSVLNQIYLPRRVYSKFSLICATTCTNEVELSPLKSNDLVF